MRVFLIEYQWGEVSMVHTMRILAKSSRDALDTFFKRSRCEHNYHKISVTSENMVNLIGRRVIRDVTKGI